MDVLLIIIIFVSITFFFIIGHFIKKYRHHHGTYREFKEYMETPVFSELTSENIPEPKKSKKHHVLGHEKIKKLVRKKK